ncbi:hypothetical protein N9153_03480 [Planctomicrobium sp.]|nr:hypothetical protein [Planctomicrobium sp.]
MRDWNGSFFGAVIGCPAISGDVMECFSVKKNAIALLTGFHDDIINQRFRELHSAARATVIAELVEKNNSVD